MAANLSSLGHGRYGKRIHTEVLAGEARIL
jgi:hypothetical protein